MEILEAISRLKTLDIRYNSEDDRQAVQMALRSLEAWDKVETDIWRETKNPPFNDEEHKDFACGIIYALTQIIKKRLKEAEL